MAVNLFDDSWKGDVGLQEKLKQYVKDALKREEILSFLRRDFRSTGGVSVLWIEG